MNSYGHPTNQGQKMPEADSHPQYDYGIQNLMERINEYTISIQTS